jgi:S1-C subfamily serine protease
MKKLVFVLITALILTGCSAAEAKPVQETEETTSAAVVAESEKELTGAQIEELKKSCVMIYAENENFQSQGTAVAIGNNKYLSVYHAIADGRTNVKTSDGEKLTIDKAIPDIDIITLDSAEGAVPANMGDISDSKSGDKIVVIGAPAGKVDTVTHTTINRIVGVIVIDGATVEGASGSGVFDMRGNLIGIVTRADAELGETYAVTINTIKKSF